MKKLSKVLMLAMLVLVLGISFAGCGVNTYTVSFNSNGGSNITSQSVEENKYATQPPMPPTKEMAEFRGWYADSNLQLPWDFNNMQIKGNTTLYAKWEDLSTLNITLPNTTMQDDGYIVKGENQQTTVAYQQEFSFFIVIDTQQYNDKNLAVTANDINLEAYETITENHTKKYKYTIPSPTYHQTIKVTGVVKKLLKVQLNMATDGFIVLDEDGYDKNAVPYGSDYKFKVVLDEGYEKHNFIVDANSEILQPDSNDVYTIKSLTKTHIISVSGVVKRSYSVNFMQTKKHADDFLINGPTKVTHGENYLFTVTLADKFSKIALENLISIVINANNVIADFIKIDNTFNFTINASNINGDIFIALNSINWQENLYTVTLPTNTVGYTINSLSHSATTQGGNQFEVEHLDAFEAEFILHNGYQHCTDFSLRFNNSPISTLQAIKHGILTISGIDRDGEIYIENVTPNNFVIEVSEQETGYTLIPITSSPVTDNGEFTFKIQLDNSHKLIDDSDLCQIEYQTYTHDNIHTQQNEHFVSEYGAQNLTRYSQVGENKNTFTISNITGNIRIKVTNIIIKTYQITLPDNNEGYSVSTQMQPNQHGKYDINHGKDFEFNVTLEDEYSLSINEIAIQIDSQQILPKELNNNTATFLIKNITRSMVVAIINVLPNHFEVQFVVNFEKNGIHLQGQYQNTSGDEYINDYTYMVVVERGTGAPTPDSNNILLPAGYTLGQPEWLGNYENINDNKIIYANFVAKKHEVRYQLNGGENHPDNYNTVDKRLTFTLEDLTTPLILKDATRGKYTFGGWYKDVNKTIKLENNEISQLENITLYAHWLLEVGTEKAFDNLQDAVDYSSLNDTILIYNGNYNTGAVFNHSLNIISAPNNNEVVFDVNQLFGMGTLQYAFGYDKQESANFTFKNITINLPLTDYTYGIYLENANVMLDNVSINGGKFAIKLAQYYTNAVIKNCNFTNLIANGAYITLNTYQENSNLKISKNNFTASATNITAISLTSPNQAYNASITDNTFASGSAVSYNSTAILVNGKQQQLTVNNNQFISTNGWQNAIILASNFSKAEFLDERIIYDYLKDITENSFENYTQYNELVYSDIIITLTEEDALLAKVYVDIITSSIVYDILSNDIAHDVFYLNSSIILSVDYIVTNNKEVQEGKTLFLLNNLTVENATLIINGTVQCNGNINNHGEIIGNGEIILFENELMLDTKYEDNLGVNNSKLNLTRASGNQFNLWGEVIKTPYFDFGESTYYNLYLVAVDVYVGVQYAGQSASLQLNAECDYYTDNIVDSFGYVSVFVNVESQGEILNAINITSGKINIDITTNNLTIYSYTGNKVIKESTLSYNANINTLYYWLEKNNETSNFADYNVYGMVIDITGDDSNIVDNYFNGMHSNHFIAFKYYVGIEYAGWLVQESWNVEVAHEFTTLGGILNAKKNGLAFEIDGIYYNRVDNDGFLNYIVDVCVLDNYGAIPVYEKINLISFTATFELDNTDYEVVINTHRTDDSNNIIKEHNLEVYYHPYSTITTRPGTAIEAGINTNRLYASAGNLISGEVIKVKENAVIKSYSAFAENNQYNGSDWFLPIRIWAGLEHIGKGVSINSIQFIGDEGARYHAYNQVLNNGYIELIIELTSFDNERQCFNLSKIVIDYTLNQAHIEKEITTYNLTKYQDINETPIQSHNLHLDISTKYTFNYNEENESYKATGNQTLVTEAENTKVFDYYNQVKDNDAQASGYFIAFNTFVGAKYYFENVAVSIVYKNADDEVLANLSEERTLTVNALGFAGVLLDALVTTQDDELVAGYNTVQLQITIGENVVSEYIIDIADLVFL